MIGSTLYFALLLAGLVLIRTRYDGRRLWPLLVMLPVIPAPLVLEVALSLARTFGLG